MNKIKYENSYFFRTLALLSYRKKSGTDKQYINCSGPGNTVNKHTCPSRASRAAAREEQGRTGER